MSNTTTPRRVRVERNIYRRPTGVFEVGFKDGAGVQRWRTVDGGIQAARATRDDLLARRGHGERVAPNPRLRFGDAAERWLTGPVSDRRATTLAGYRYAIEHHLMPRYRTRRMDAITPDDLVRMIREMRAQGLAESTIAATVAAAGRVFKYAARRLGWAGQNPVAELEAAERPRVGQTKRPPIFEGTQLDQTLSAANEPFRTLFTLVALTGARVSEMCGLTWANVRLDPDESEVTFGSQVDRQGNRQPTKTDSSARTVPIPGELAALLARHKLASTDTRGAAFVFATRTGRPLSQRNVSRALRAAQRRARDEHGRPTFPILHERDASDQPVKVPRAAVPSMHSFRHTVASRALVAGESVDEVAFLLGHRNGNVTRAVYVREVADARRRAFRRGQMLAEYGSALEAATAASTPTDAVIGEANVRPLRRSS